MKLPSSEIWYVTGSQHLYGEAARRQVAANSQKIVEELNATGALPLPLVFKPILTRPEEVTALIRKANCAGLVLWMHTFSPSKMWINGLLALRKPFLHLHTQFGRDLPWGEIDMDFMNLHQSAHGDREAGFIHTRLRLNRKVVVGHWSDRATQHSVGDWMRAARAWADWQGGRFVRFGDNMRYVAVTDGDKVAAEARFGFAVNTHGVGDLAAVMQEVSDADIDALCAEYEASYRVVDALLIYFHVQDDHNFIFWNLGGWGNIGSGLEQTVDNTKEPVSERENVTIDTDRWYDIKIEVKGRNVRCSLDGNLLTETTVPAGPTKLPVYTSALRDNATGDVILKVVNLGDGPQSIRIDLAGATTVSQGTQEVITGDPDAMNSVPQPTAIVPRKESLTNPGKSFEHEFPGKSVRVLRLKK